MTLQGLVGLCLTRALLPQDARLNQMVIWWDSDGVSVYNMSTFVLFLHELVRPVTAKRVTF